jgi:hypothetical protein
MQVCVQKLNTDKPLVEAPIFVKRSQKGRVISPGAGQAMGFLTNLAAVNRSRPFDFRGKGPALAGYPSTGEILLVPERKARWHHHQADYSPLHDLVMQGGILRKSDQPIVAMKPL